MSTIYEIAKRAGVSIGTVDRVVHQRGNVAKKTEEKVRKVLDDMNYQPSIYARGLALSRTYRFGILTPHPRQDSKYWQLPLTGVENAAKELNHHKVVAEYFHYDKYDPDDFRRICKSLSLAFNHLDGLIIAPVLSAQTADLVTKIPSRIPYVFIDSFLPKTNCLTYVGQASYQSGRLAAHLMCLLMPNGGTIGTMRIQPRDIHIEDRILGFNEFLKNYSRFSVIITDVARSKDDNAYYISTFEMLKKNKEMNSIFVPIACANQVAACISKEFDGRRVHVIGYDLIQESVGYLKEGTIDFLISQRPEIQGYRALYSLFRHVVLREKIAKEIIIPSDIITRENVDFYLKDIHGEVEHL